MFRKNCAKALGVFLTDPGSQIWHSANLRLANGHVKSSSMLSVDVSNGLHEELETLALRTQSSSRRSSIARSRDWISDFHCAATGGFMLRARLKWRCCSQFFERQMKVGFGLMTLCTCETVSSAQQTDRCFASVRIATRHRSYMRPLDGRRRSRRLRTQ